MFGSYTQCYSAARDGWSILKFHRLCDGKPNTVSIFNDGYAIFGGYTDVPWKSKKHETLLKLFQYYFNTCPGRLLKFSIFYLGPYSRGALTK